MAQLEPLRRALKRASQQEPETAPTATEPEPESEPEHPAIEHEHPAALDLLVSTFDLSPFERDVLLLCAGIELDNEFARLCTTAQGGSLYTAPTFNLALTLLPDAYWLALSPVAPLRFWQLIVVEKEHPLLFSPLHIDERILHYLVGLSYLDRRLAHLLQPLSMPAASVPSHQQLAREIIATWSTTDASELPSIELSGNEPASQRGIAALVGSLTNRQVFLLQATALPSETAALEEMLHLWKREALLDEYILLLDCQEVDHSQASAERAIARLVEDFSGPLILCSQEPHAWLQRANLTLQVHKPTSEEQLLLWRSALHLQTAELDTLLLSVISHFSFDATAIQALAARVQTRMALSSQTRAPEQISTLLWDACRHQVRPGLGELAQRIETTAHWEDLILPELQTTVLHTLVMHVRQRRQVYETWGFARKTARGLGISALFVGSSGTGKTMAAEVLANELHMDLYRIDLSSVVSKYIGETEKHLKRIFDAAEESSALLLFDEADALLGKRSEVKDSHDRYANIEVSYLLQRMEAYRGLVLLTTNMKDALDTAFLRRIRFIVQFPFPDAGQRAEIWQHVFPLTAPVDRLDMARLAQLNISGGNIANIALNAAFMAADASEAIGMQHLLRAARHEYAKLEKTLTGTELQGWAL